MSGELPERLNGTVSKTVDSFGVRGFESHLLRQEIKKRGA